MTLISNSFFLSKSQNNKFQLSSNDYHIINQYFIVFNPPIRTPSAPCMARRWPDASRKIGPFLRRDSSGRGDSRIRCKPPLRMTSIRRSENPATPSPSRTAIHSPAGTLSSRSSPRPNAPGMLRDAFLLFASASGDGMSGLQTAASGQVVVPVRRHDRQIDRRHKFHPEKLERRKRLPKLQLISWSHDSSENGYKKFLMFQNLNLHPL